jgi:hypothetical protein
MQTKSQIFDRIKQLCAADDRIVGAINYGSDAKGNSDEWSDIDVIFFINDADLQEFLEHAEGWLREIGGIVESYTPNHSPRIFVDSRPCPIRVDTAFWPAARISEISEFNWKPTSLDSMLIYERPTSSAICHEIARLSSAVPRRNIDLQKEFHRLECDIWYYLIRIYGLLQRKETALALTEYQWCIIDYIGWLFLLDNNDVINWRAHLSVNRIRGRIPHQQVLRLEACLPINNKNLLESVLQSIHLSNELITKISSELNLSRADALADRVLSLYGVSTRPDQAI